MSARDDARQQRLQADFEAMEALKASSSILQFEADGEPPERYRIAFRGNGLRRDAASGRIEPVDKHECEIRLTVSYPQRPPAIRWLTPLFHPNVSFGGFIRLDDIGLAWAEDLSLDAVCERLWDVARLAHYDLAGATNYAAKHWVEQQSEIALPVDARPLRDRMSRANSNVVRYRRRDDQGIALPDGNGATEDVLYIDEDTPVPSLPSGCGSRRRDDDDVLYIGDE